MKIQKWKTYKIMTLIVIYAPLVANIIRKKFFDHFLISTRLKPFLSLFWFLLIWLDLKTLSTFWSHILQNLLLLLLSNDLLFIGSVCYYRNHRITYSYFTLFNKLSFVIHSYPRLTWYNTTGKFSIEFF